MSHFSHFKKVFEAWKKHCWFLARKFKNRFARKNCWKWDFLNFFKPLCTYCTINNFVALGHFDTIFMSIIVLPFRLLLGFSFCGYVWFWYCVSSGFWLGHDCNVIMIRWWLIRRLFWSYYCNGEENKWYKS